MGIARLNDRCRCLQWLQPP